MGWLLSCLLEGLEWDSGQGQGGSRKILPINKETRHRRFNSRRVKTVVFVSKQGFVSWFFYLLLLGDSKDLPILCDFGAFPHVLPQGDPTLHTGKLISLPILPFSSFPLEPFSWWSDHPQAGAELLSNPHIPMDTQSPFHVSMELTMTTLLLPLGSLCTPGLASVWKRL